MKEDLIEELQWYNWKMATGNPQNLSEEQFNLLKKEGALTFPTKIKAEKAEKEDW